MEDRIKQIRKAKGLTQQEFADCLGIKRGAVANYEVGRNQPIDAVVALICEKFDVNETWLRTGKGSMFVEVDRDEEIARFVAKATSGRKNNLQRRFLSLLSSMTDEEIEVMANLMDRFSATKDNEDEEADQ